MTGGRSGGQSPKIDQARELTAAAIDRLTDQLNAGTSTELDAFLKAMSRFHRYSFSNIMLILAQRPDASKVAGFHTWKSLGRSVKRGEKGIIIIAPMTFRSKRDDQAEDRDDNDDDGPRLRFRAAHVFDVSQTEGDPLPEPNRVGGNPGDALSRLEAAVRAAGITVETDESLGGAAGVSMGGKIVLAADQCPAERFSTLVHEWAHEILHQSDKENRPPKTVRETEAEAVAFVVGHAIGLDVGTASADYIQLYRGDADTLTASLDRIQKAADVVLVALDQDPDPSRTVRVDAAVSRHAEAMQRQR